MQISSLVSLNLVFDFESDFLQVYGNSGDGQYVPGPMQQSVGNTGNQSHFVQARRPVTIANPNNLQASNSGPERGGRRYSSMNARR